MRITTADAKHRVTLPGAKKGDAFSVSPQGPGRYLLEKVAPEKSKAKEAPLVKLRWGKDGLPKMKVKISRAEVARAIREERDSR